MPPIEPLGSSRRVHEAQRLPGGASRTYARLPALPCAPPHTSVPMRSSREALRAVALVVVAFIAPTALASPLVDAARDGDVHAVVHMLREQPESVRAIDARGFTALHWAAIREHWDAVRVLVRGGAPVDAAGGDGGTPLHWACHHDRADIVRLLLDRGARHDVANRWGRTPLHVAARRGCAEVVELLLSRGADPAATTKEGWSPLHVAEMSGHPEIASVLTHWGAPAELQDAEGKTAAQLRRTRPTAIPLPATLLDDYVGDYPLGDGFGFKVWREGERLRMREFAPDTLVPYGPDLFGCAREPWTVRFERGVDGDVSGIVVDFLRRQVRGPRHAPKSLYVGSHVCAQCHMDQEHGAPYLAWLRSRHAAAYWRLATDWAAFLAKRRPVYRHIDAPLDSEACLLCHVSGAQDPEAFFADTFRREEGVGCESCHGPGSAYIDPAVMADLESFLAHGGIVPDENTCKSCHRRPGFVFHEMEARIAHPHPAASPSTAGSHH